MFPAQPNQSLIDGIAVLQALTVSAEPVGSRQLARELGMEPTRVNRLARTLLALGFLRQTPDRKYTAGPGVHVLAAQSLYASGLIRAAVPVLEELHATGFTVALGVLWRDHVCYLYHGRRGMTAAEAIGTTGLYPAAASGIGHVLLAARNPDHLPPGSREPSPELRPALASVAARGWAHVVRRRQPVEATLAVAIGKEPYAALALAGAISASSVPRLLPRLRKAAVRIDAATAPDPLRRRTAAHASDLSSPEPATKGTRT